MTGKTIPNIHSCGYSVVPLRVADNDVFFVDNYKYITNITYDKKNIILAEIVQFNGIVSTKIYFSDSHKFKLGEVILLEDSNNFYSGYYNIISVGSNFLVINLTPAQAFMGSGTVSKVFAYNTSPNPDGEIKTDIGNALKNFVTQNLEDVNECFAGPQTRFEYELNLGSENKAIFQFFDDVFTPSGNTGFINSGLTSVTDVDFNIGDEIIISRDLAEWSYYDNFFFAGNVGFTSLTQTHNFQTGDTVTITGQITNPQYNGIYQVTNVPDAFSLVISLPFGNSTPVEGGKIYGVVNPQYNTTTSIRDIYFQTVPFSGVVIETFLSPGISTLPIGGTIKHLDGRLITDFSKLNYSGLNVYNSYVPDNLYDMDFMNKYVVKNSASTENSLSTIYAIDEIFAPNTKLRIEKSAKSWLLCHNASDYLSSGATFVWRSKTNAILGLSYIKNESGNGRDFYIPVGVDQVLASTNRVDTVALSGIVNSIDTYVVSASSGLAAPRSNSIRFQINKDCSGYEMYHLMWKDAMGSWITFPFKYVSRDRMSVERKDYYKDSGNWDNDKFGYDSFDRGQTTFFTRSRDRVILNSGWVSEIENNIIKDLMNSARVYIQTPDNILYGATIVNTDIEFGKLDNDGVWQYSFEVVFSNNVNRY